MRRIATLLALAMLASPTVAAQEDGPILCWRQDTQFCPDEVTIDLLEDAGDRVELEVEVDRFPFIPQTVTLFMDCDCGASMTFSMPRDGDVFVNAVQVDDIDLVTGTWTATPQGSGSGQTQALDSRILIVVADDQLAPGLVIEDLDEATNTVSLGAGSLLRTTPSDELLGRVTYRTDWMPPNPFELAFPYDVAVGTFRPGLQEVTVTAHDRAGHTTTKTFNVFADALDPEVSVDAPDVFYQGIENPVHLTVKENSAYDATVSVGDANATLTEAGDATHQALTIPVVPQDVGASILRIRVTDALGNDVVLETPAEVRELETNALLVDAEQTNQPIAGEALEVQVTARQQGALAPVDFDVTFNGETLGTVPVPGDAEVTGTVETRLEPGRYTGTLRLDPPGTVTELNFTDQQVEFTLEVFLARVIHGDDRYHIRADDRGLPVQAVAEDGSIYTIAVEDEGLGQVYAFKADGQRLYWNPASNTTVIPTATEGGTTDDNGIPSLGLGLLVAALGAALFLRKRR